MPETDELEDLELTDEEKRKKAAPPEAIGTPIASSPAEGTPSEGKAIGTPIPPPTGALGIYPTPETQSTPVTGDLTPPPQASIGTPLTPPTQPAMPHARPNYDAYETQLHNKAGVDNVHGFGGALLKGLDIAGSIVAPGQMSLVPGTRLHHQAEVNRAGRAAGVENQEIASQGEEAYRGAQTDEQQALAEKNRNIPDKSEQWSEVPGIVGPGGKVLQQEKNSGQMRWAPGIEGVEPLKPPIAHNPTFQEQSYDEWHKTNPNGTRMQFEEQLKKSERTPPEGSYMPLYDEKGHVTGAWNPKTGHMANAPGGMTGTTGPGQHIASTAEAAVEKKSAPLQSVVDEAAKAQTLKDAADAGNAEADVDLALTFFKTMRSANSGSSGIRFTQQENNLIMGSRNLWEGIEVKGNKVFSHGEPLGPEQRQQVLDVINIHRDAAMRQLQELKGGGTPAPASGGTVPSFAEWKAKQGQP